MKDENKKDSYFAQLKGYKKAMPIAFAALAVFSALCVFSHGSGFLGNGIGTILRGIFSIGGYFLPFLLGIHALCYAEDTCKNRFIPRLFFSLTIITLASVIEYAICFWSSEAIFAPADFYSDEICGGFVGGVLGFVLAKLFGSIGAIVISTAILAIFAIFFYADRTGEFGQKALKVANVIFGFLAKTEGQVKQIIEEKKNEKAEREEEEHRNRSDELLNDSFFDNSGVENLKIDELGIGTDIPEEPVEAPARPQKKRSADKPLDLNYGIEEPLPAEPKPAEFKEQAKGEENPFADIYGIDDNPENVFTKSFDPFNFATGEQIASKPSSKATFEEELDDLTLAEFKSEPTEKEKRLMELERRKQMWLERNKAASANAAAPQNVPQVQTTVEQPASAPKEQPEVTGMEAHTPSEQAQPQHVATPHKSDVPKEVNAYTSYSSTQTTYTQPIKTVEFTINGNSAPAPSAPKESNEITKTYDKNEGIDKDTEDVAAFIAEKIARANPAYARSANEMVTYTKVTHSPGELATNETQSDDFDSVADKIIADSGINSSPITEYSFENSESVSAENAEENAESRLNGDEGDLYFPATSGTASSAIENSDNENDESREEISFEEQESFESASNIETMLFDTPELSSDENTILESADVEEEDEATIDDADCALTESTPPSIDKTEDYSPSLELSDAQPENVNTAKASYERAAGFISGLAAEASTAPKEFVPEFKPYEAPTPSETVPSHEAPAAEETLKVERAMLSPSVSSVSEKVIIESSEDTAASSDESVVIADANNTETAASTLETTITFTDADEVTEFVADTELSQDTEMTDVQKDEEKIDWQNEEAVSTVSTPSEDTIEMISFTEDVAEDEAEEEEKEEIPVPDSYNTLPEEDDVQTEEIPPEEQNPDVIKMREMFPFLNPIGATPAPTAQEDAPAPAEEDNDDAPPFDDAVVVSTPAHFAPAPSAALVSVEEVKKEEKKANKPDYSNYEFPSIELLAKEDAFSDENIQSEIQENADKLIETLASFGVTASIKGVDRGPRITRYEVVPAKGVKVSSILNLQDDIALNLAAGAIRMEAPIPGKSAVGIEIPNKKSSTVRLRNLLETEDFISSKSKTTVCIGRDVAGQPVFGDISKMPHLLIAGATGMGKSVCINALMISILYKAKPDEVKFIMIDPKQVEFTMYNGIPHLLVPVVSDAKQAAGALMWAVEEMERRYNLLNPLCVRNIEAYNEKVTADPSLGDPMTKIVIVIDEFADLMLQVKDPVETLVMRIAQKARAAGIYLVIGTQRPSVNVITGVIKANVPSRISCKVMSNVDSKTVLDSAGAEKLLDRGDMLFAPAGSPKPHRVQGAFVADGEVEAIMAHLKKFSDGSNYDSNVMEEIERAAQKCSKKGGGSSDHDDGDDEVHGEGYLNDRQFLDAVEVAVNTRKISTSLIQRKLSIGYGKAAKFIDIMEEMGIVGEANGQRPREVRITPDEWREKLARATLD